jgi:hypothetical protein
MNRAGQIDLVVNTNGSNKAPVSIAQCSDQTLTLATSIASSLLKYGESGLPRANIPKLRPAKILDKWSGNDGGVVDERTDQRPRPFVFSKDDDRPLNDGQSPAKRRRRASSASSLMHPGKVRTPPVTKVVLRRLAWRRPEPGAGGVERSRIANSAYYW